MAYDSLESYVQKNLYDPIYDAIEYYCAYNGYIGTDYINSSNSYLFRVDESYRQKYGYHFLKLENIDVHSVRCNKLSYTDYLTINGSRGIRALYKNGATYFMEYCDFVQGSPYGKIKKSAIIDNLITMEISLSADILYKASDQTNGKETLSIDNRKFIVTFLAELVDNLNIIGEIDITELYGNDFKSVSITDTYLLPEITLDELENLAKTIYVNFYSQHYSENYNFPYKEFIQALGLKEIIVDFKDSNIFGRMYFKSAEVDDIISIDGGPEISAPLSVSEGTILISRTRYFMEDYGSLYNTVAHELVHWLLHKDFFKILCLLSDKPAELSCDIMFRQLNDSMTGVQKAIWWAEWQANSLAAHITMPKEDFLDVLTSYCFITAEYESLNHETILEHAICRTADTFGVSKYAAKDRAIQLGILEAEGTLLFHNGEHIPPISFNRNALKMNQTFIIDKKSYLNLLDTNREFAALIHHREYVFAECVVVQNKPKYVKRTSSPQLEYELTEYARNHADECCMHFEKQYLDDSIHYFEFYGQCYLSKELTDKILLKIGLSEDEITEHKKGHNEQGIIAKLACEGDSLMSTMRKLPNSFSGTLDHYMKNGTFNDNKEVSNHDLSELTGLSEDYIRKIRKEENHNISLRTAYVICMGLHLPPLFSRDLLRKARVDFPYTKQGYMQRVFLEEYFTEGLGVVDEILQKNGLARLTYDKAKKKQKKS